MEGWEWAVAGAVGAAGSGPRPFPRFGATSGLAPGTRHPLLPPQQHSFRSEGQLLPHQTFSVQLSPRPRAGHLRRGHVGGVQGSPLESQAFQGGRGELGRWGPDQQGAVPKTSRGPRDRVFPVCEGPHESPPPTGALTWVTGSLLPTKCTPNSNSGREDGAPWCLPGIPRGAQNAQRHML